MTCTKPRRNRFTCESCQVVRINGVLCHETGCPDAWKTATRDCKECGREFRPKERGQKCCSKRCNRAYFGW